MNNKAKNYKKASDAQIQQLQKQLEELKNSKSTSTTNNQASGTFAVNIPEIGITLNVPDAIKDLEYGISTGYIGKNNIKVTSALFSTSSLVKSEPNCKDSLGSISKIESQYNSSNTYGYGPLIKQYPSYYLVFTGPQATCSNDQKIIDQQTQALNYLKKAIIGTFELGQDALK